MIIQKVIIQNFQCYYQYNEFLFDKGLNIVMGSNSHGKSKLFDAIYWLLTERDYDQNYNQENLISVKAAESLEEFEVSVAMEINKEGEIFFFERKFGVKSNKGDITQTKTQFSSFTQNAHGERIPQGIELLDSIFPNPVRRYCLFKGERSINIFDHKKNPDALNNLLNNLSSFKSLDRFVEIANKLLETTKISIERQSKRSATDKKKRESKINIKNALEKEIKTLEFSIRENEKNHTKAIDLREEIIGQLEIGEHITNINNRIRDLQRDISRIDGLIETKTNYTVKLFDDFWILKPYLETQKLFEAKYKKFEKDRRKASEEFAKQQGKKELLSHLTDTPLPIGVPEKQHLEEMLEEEICKVCNREANKGSDAYNYMQKRLESFLKTLKPQFEGPEEKPFENEFIDEFNDMNRTLRKQIPAIESIQTNIQENLDFVNRRRAERNDLLDRLRKEELDKEKLLSESSLGEKSLIEISQKIKGYDADIERYSSIQFQDKNKLAEKCAEFDKIQGELKKINIQELPSYLIEKEEIAEDIFEIVKTTRKAKLDELIDLIRVKSNEFYSKLGLASGGYTGQIEFYKDNNDHIRIFSVDKSGKENAVTSLSSSTNTSLYLSILLAISKLSTEKYNDSFPMLFDAPTSEFDESRSFEFLKQSKDNFEQCIIMTKTFINEDHSISKRLNELAPSVAYKIKLDDDIDPQALETIETKTEKII